MNGLTYAQIADSIDPSSNPANPTRLYSSAGAARIAVLASQNRHSGEVEPKKIPTGERRSLADDRYERIIQAWMPKALKGDKEAAKIVNTALAQQAQLYGLNLRPAAAPIDTAGGEDTVDDIGRKRAERQAAARAAASAASPPP
ncbi:MAG TPA: hypothetical protein VGW74_17265, partial [Propionibacteriaceae bacterium]|nr:hypothetical protein [Propionibacteriaceae bacterium]